MASPRLQELLSSKPYMLAVSRATADEESVRERLAEASLSSQKFNERTAGSLATASSSGGYSLQGTTSDC